jgi:hypothetical protein
MLTAGMDASMQASGSDQDQKHPAIGGVFTPSMTR